MNKFQKFHFYILALLVSFINYKSKKVNILHMQYFEIILIDISRYAISNESLERGFQRLVNIKCFFSSGLCLKV